MKVISVLNNSALVASDKSGIEYVLIGKGISFQKRTGDIVDMLKVEKQFIKNTHNTHELFKLFGEIPEKYFEITCSIIRYANKKLSSPLNNGIYITLFDHINSAIERYESNVCLNFGMISEIKMLYPKEFEIAQWAVDYINATLDIELPNDECGFISIHLINATFSEGNITKTKKVLNITKEISDIVSDMYSEEIDENSMAYARFATHLKYFAIRYFSNNQMSENSTISLSFNNSVLDKCMPCVNRIDDYLNNKYAISIKRDEKKYLILHLCRLLTK